MPHMGGRHGVCGYSLGLKTTHLTEQQHTTYNTQWRKYLNSFRKFFGRGIL